LRVFSVAPLALAVRRASRAGRQHRLQHNHPSALVLQYRQAVVDVGHVH
jgi:hypothetical protein